MTTPLRDAWTRIVKPADYDAHMRATGQASANAALIAQMIAVHPPAAGDSVLVAGAGTGQMFDYLDPQLFRFCRILFCDVNDDFLDVLRGRVAVVGNLEYRTQVDDLERSTLAESFDTAMVVLVLEHIDWRAGVRTLTRLARRQVLVIIQENPSKLTSAVSGSRPPAGSMRIFAGDAKPALVSRCDLTDEFRRAGFRLVHTAEQRVLDDKRMVALVFQSFD